MSLVADLNEARRERLIRLGAMPCPRCELVKRALAEKEAVIAAQQAKLEEFAEREKIWLSEQFERARQSQLDRARTASVDPGKDVPPAAISVDCIVSLVSKFYGLIPSDIRGDRRTADCVKPRHVAIYLAVKWTGRSMPAIGRLFGGRDHTTILSGNAKIKRLRAEDSDLDGEITKIERLLGVVP